MTDRTPLERRLRRVRPLELIPAILLVVLQAAPGLTARLP